jgi:hypothetical protein
MDPFLRLKKECGATERTIARSIGIACSTVALTLDCAAAEKLHWPLPATLTGRGLEAMLYVSTGAPKGWSRKAEPDWTYAIATSASLHADAAVEGMSGFSNRAAMVTADGAGCTGEGRLTVSSMTRLEANQIAGVYFTYRLLRHTISGDNPLRQRLGKIPVHPP